LAQSSANFLENGWRSLISEVRRRVLDLKLEILIETELAAHEPSSVDLRRTRRADSTHVSRTSDVCGTTCAARTGDVPDVLTGRCITETLRRQRVRHIPLRAHSARWHSST
jgi:hypothetical protein